LPLVAVNEIERTHSGPVCDGERMYLRTYDSILCIARNADGARHGEEARERARAAVTKQEAK
jgi:hypothetical protein